ncbi:hypothetical protein BOTBODRAFT_168907 [Botryobasidium botryosum FD-172 SS1]|uniref:Uncharacterized protein n=1 Tax=Botryobasidium botryosum (strain FD-172 SS1) TaxID=930990 RepID=A0A067NC23_BOTB1|nr:hypothetical protein BOTBODRAFT_168907 [Botryobasidium botryosum FD-172 SS1]
MAITEHPDITITPSPDSQPAPSHESPASYYSSLPDMLRPSPNKPRFTRKMLKELEPFDALPFALIPNSKDPPRYPNTVHFDEYGNPSMEVERRTVAYLSEKIGYSVCLDYVVNASEQYIIVLGNNYTLGLDTPFGRKQVPTLGVLRKLAVLLGRPANELPKWYIDDVHWEWREKR